MNETLVRKLYEREKKRKVTQLLRQRKLQGEWKPKHAKGHSQVPSQHDYECERLRDASNPLKVSNQEVERGTLGRYGFLKDCILQHVQPHQSKELDDIVTKPVPFWTKEREEVVKGQEILARMRGGE